MDGAWLQTFSGKAFFPLSPSPADICIADIAHALSLLTRFGGHTREFYSVAEHSVRVSYEVPLEHALWALLHDASEAYLVDMPRPIKHAPGFATYRQAEAKLMRAVCERFGLPLEEPFCVKRADNILLVTEQRDLLGPQVIPWVAFRGIEPLAHEIKPWSAEKAEEIFLIRFRALNERATVTQLEAACELK